MHVQRMLEMDRFLYTGGNFNQNVWKKSKGNGDFIYDHDLTILRFGANLFLLKYIMRSLIARRDSFTSGKC